MMLIALQVYLMVQTAYLGEYWIVAGAQKKEGVACSLIMGP